MRYAAHVAALTLAFITITSSKEITPIDAYRTKLFAFEEELWKNVTDNNWDDKTELGADIELTKAFKRLDEDLSSLPRRNRLQIKNWLWGNTFGKLQLIDGMYRTFLEFCQRQSAPGTVPSPVREWLDLAEHVLQDPQSVSQAVRKLDDILRHGDLFRSVLQEENPDLCDLQMSPHQLIYDMYNAVSLTEIKGYAMMQFSWMLLKIYGKGNFTQEASLTRQRYGERAVKTAYAAKTALEMASRKFYRCDPISHIEGVTYDEVTRLLQGYIENEVDLNAEGTCKENCAYYTYAEKHRSFAEFSQQQPPCRGKVINCGYIDSDMIICPSNNPKRRYDWIEYENGRQLGQMGSCRNRKQVDSWWRWLFWHCSYCMCYCDDDRNSDRYFSLQEAIVDTKNNKVVTGVKLLKINRVFHLQVTDGTLGERGSVTPGEILPVHIIDINDRSLMNGRDYHMLTYEKRAIDLDQLESPTGSVLTGVRFRMIGAHLHFEILTTPFNYTTGRLFPERSQWISNDNTEGADSPRTQLNLIQPDIPTRNHKSIKLSVDSTHDQYVEFVNSDLDADAAQSTVPFIDIQDVKPLKGASLLSGAGLVHKGKPGSGGFIALSVTTYDYSQHVHAEPPPEEEEPEQSTDMSTLVN